MFGIEDPGVWIAYILAFICLVFSLCYGISHWDKEEK